MPLLDLFWSMFWIFMWIAWIWMLVRIFADILRSDSSGLAKAGWSLLILFLPFLGVFVYLVVHGGDMQRRDDEDAAALAAASANYIRSVAGTDSVDVGDQLHKLADLRERGAISDGEFEQAKAKLLA